MEKMISQTTKGVKVTVKTEYEGNFFKTKKVSYAFSYTITIENVSDHYVQVKGRFWEIYDSLNSAKVVHGEGVVGEQPIIEPGSKYTYSSGCVLNSPLGGMKGFYEVMNMSTNRFFNVEIPSFKLSAPFVLN
ncbi:Co2+/Mg2+ efflux protein ApaG [Myroides marinus]|uniref:ApaG protein n=1 Tax=Myroides marinus TaxID=703342 RepID=A0A161SFR4_9FLAO|nr:Co2+/Mg2+ efflux protein ApaG [Myroides marinus]KUF38662.1 Co2+/Mg2+ efflux protein ApaG [Myroides marinus]KZE79905.1 Co2+/Mg2+ efflux protein ApaG [Myroides marinus]MDM1346931.1 Co2+/Mg2+ efflux protein ApaG [Myroides marinus]MDM1350385.1 Co2+/Mg2+ efflux protein ApaG [Myroides marinus]MDM1354185.1 Co2+/Mg2+ efflux protein ApaG [Myroides marinus]